MFGLFKKKVKNTYIKVSINNNGDGDVICMWPAVDIKDSESVLKISREVVSLIVVTIKPNIWSSVRNSVSAYGLASNNQIVAKTIHGMLDSLINQNHINNNEPVISPLEAFKND